MKELKKLINVKTIVTILVTILFCVLAFNKVITGEQVNSAFLMVISFYFGTQFEKTSEKREENDESK